MMRVGWIFKTESIIMPAVLDAIGGDAWLRGMLPLLNRFGQSVPPLLAARQIKILPQKKWAQAFCTLLMAGCFITLSAVFTFATNAPSWFLPATFLVCYFFFFMATGVNLLTFNTLQGKLIKPTHRGRLLMWANIVGASAAIACALYLMPQWLTESGGDFKMLFAVSACCFVVAAIIATTLAEPSDRYTQVRSSVADLFRNAWRLVRYEPTFRLLAIVASLFGVSIMLFPHYQSLGRESLDLSFRELVTWVVVQNAGTAMFSFIVGPIADRFGNRLVLNIVLLAVGAAPLFALSLAYLGPIAANGYVLVFLLVGMTPVTIRALNNYTLEIVKPSEHPHYLSSLSLCIGAPILLSPVLGLFVDHFGFTAPFLVVSGMVLIAWLLTFWLPEPRHWPDNP